MDERKPPIDYEKPEAVRRPRQLSGWFLLTGIMLSAACAFTLHAGQQAGFKVIGYDLLSQAAFIVMLVAASFILAACVLFVIGR